VVLELLPVLDNLERALQHADKSEDSTTIVDGVRMVQRQFVTALEKHGVQGFDAKGEHFDPQKHEAIQQIDTTEHQTGFVLEEYQKGYYLHERLIRPALVVVARNPAGEVVVDASLDEGEDDAAVGADPPEVESSDSEPSDGNDESAVN
jgi:molecular chaperone GrpE